MTHITRSRPTRYGWTAWLEDQWRAWAARRRHRRTLVRISNLDPHLRKDMGLPHVEDQGPRDRFHTLW